LVLEYYGRGYLEATMSKNTLRPLGFKELKDNDVFE
jgi:hypothetical protein